MKKEAITHGVLEDLANRNENWDKLDGVPEKVTELDESRLILKNEIVNGDFSDGTVGWKGYQRVEGGLPVMETTTNELVRLSQPQKLILNDNYYVCFDVENLTEDNYIYSQHDNLVEHFVNSNGRLNITYSFKGSGVEPSNIFTIGLYRKNGAIKVHSASLINLTQTFGAGNEPTKEEMDIIMDTIGYFNGTHTITSKEQFNILLRMVRENALATTSLGGGF